MKIIRGILILIFAVEGITKLLSLKFQTDFFAGSYYPSWFMYLIGILELAGAIGLLVPKFRKYANLGLLGIVIGAFYTHIIIRRDAFQMMILAIVALVLLSIHLKPYLKK